METLKEYMINSQFHGLRFITEEGRHILERLFWLVCVLVSWYFSMLLFKDYWESFITSPISFVTETDYVHWNTSFFSVSVCEDKNDHTVYNLAREIYGEDFDNKDNMEEVLLEIAHFRGTGAFINKYCLELNRNCPKGGLKDIANKARSPCKGLFQTCHWMEEEFDCCKYFLKLETELGLCYSINSIQTREQRPLNTKSNRMSGPGTMRLLLMLPSNIYIHAPEEVPYLNVKDSEVLVSTADLYKRYSYRILETTNEPGVRDVSVEQRQCRFSNENPLSVYRGYSYSACIVQCRMEAQLKLCNCSSHLLNQTKHACTLRGLNCLQEQLPKHLPMTNDGLKCSCLPSCNEPQYDFLDYETYGGIGEYAEIELALSDLPVVRLKRQVVRGALDLVVSIGGSAGLFVGASMLSFVEVIYYFTIRALWNKVMKKREAKKQADSDNKRKVGDEQLEGSRSSVITMPVSHRYPSARVQPKYLP